MESYSLTTEMIDTPVSIYPFDLIKEKYNLNGVYQNYNVDIDIHELKMENSDGSFVVFEIDKPIENRNIVVTSNQLGMFTGGVGNFKYSVSLPCVENDFEFVFKNNSSRIIGASFTLTATKLSSMSVADKVDKAYKRYCFINDKNMRVYKKVFVQSIRKGFDMTDRYPELDKYKIYDVDGVCNDGYIGIVCVMTKEDIIDMSELIDEEIIVSKYTSANAPFIVSESIDCDYTVTIYNGMIRC